MTSCGIFEICFDTLQETEENGYWLLFGVKGALIVADGVDRVAVKL